MTRLARVAAVVVAIAVGSVPLVADWCALSCETAHTAAAEVAPACHHTGSATTRVGDVPAPCGHDHHPVLVDAATTAAAALRVLPATTFLATVSAASVPSIAAVGSRTDRVAISPPLPLTLASSLRI